MYFTECASLAEKHPNLAGVIQQVDTQLAKMGSTAVIRTHHLASFLRKDPNQIGSVLEMLSQEDVLRREEMIECPHCSMTALRSECQAQLEADGEYRCTSCDRPLAEGEVKAITTYRRGEKWKETLLPPATSPKEAPSPQLDENAWYTHDQLAEAFDVGKDALRKRLDRYRKSNLGDGWKEKTDRRPREPKYIYQYKEIKHIIEELRASSERPAK